jgi:phosphatidylinositol alpha-1,6-mannosyltransferase
VHCLLVASYFAPINGGSAVVYETLCRFAPPGSMIVLAPRYRYETGEEVSGWREFDASANYPIYRTDLLRPRELPAPASRLHSVWRQLTIDLPLKIRVFFKTWQIVRAHDINVICIGELSSGSWLGIACQRLLGCKMISYIHGEEVTTESEHRFFGQHRRRYLKKADAVVAVSEFTRRALVRIMRIPKDKITLIHNGVDTARFSPAPRSQTLIDRHGLAGKRIILSVGRVVPRKGMDAMIRALPAVLAAVPDAHYLVVGGGEYRATLEALAAQFGVADAVTFAGRVPNEELVDYYRLCDLFVMANREMPDGDTEGFGLVFLEANACGKPVVGGKAGGAVEAGRDGENGLLVDGWSVRSIEGAVIRLLTDDALYQRIAEQGLEIARAADSRNKAMEFNALCRRLVGE